MKENEKKVEETQGVETQMFKSKEAKFSASVAVRGAMTNVLRLRSNKLINDQDTLVINEIMKKVGMRIMGIEVKD